MRNLSLTVPEPASWDAFYSVSGDADVLFCPTEEAVSVGEVIRVKVIFLGGPRFFVTGVVIWRRPGGARSGRLRAGVGVRLNQSERSKITYIRGYARGGLLDKRRSARLPVRLQVTYPTGGVRRMNFTRNITDTGLLLATTELLPLQTDISLTVLPPLERTPERIRGKVVRHVEDDGGRAIGVELRFTDDVQRERFAALVREIERAFNRGELDERFIAK